MKTSLHQQFSDEQLVLAFQQRRDMGIIEILYRRYYHNVFYYCYKMIGNWEDAQDATGDIFLKMIENLESLQHAITFQAWLFRIARNQATNVYYRKQKNRHSDIDHIPHPAQVGMPLKEHWTKDAQIEKKEEVFRSLPTDTRELLKKKYQDGESIESLMKRYQISKSAVKMRLARGRQKARKQLAESAL